MNYKSIKSSFLALLSGALLTLSMPGSGGLWPLVFLALVPLFSVVVQSAGKQKLVYALIAGLCHYCSQIYWISGVLATFGGLPIVVGYIAVLGLALYMSVYLLIFAKTFTPIAKRPGVGIWLIPALWVGLDWLRAQLLTGFPWMDLGYALAFTPKLIQFADLFGHYGLTFIIVQTNVVLFLVAQKIGSAKKSDESITLPNLSLGLYGLLLISICVYNVQARAKVENSLEHAHREEIALIQGNVDQSHKWSPEYRDGTLRKYLKLTEQVAQERQLALVVWPETALPFYPEQSSLTRVLEKAVEAGEFALLTGAPWYERGLNKEIAYYNSAQLLASDRGFVSSYYKSHLVPFGEYVPLREFLPFLNPLVESVGDFRAGTIENPLEWGRMSVGVLICFESVFPDIARKWSENGVNLLVNLTNDAWYGRSSAPYHSLAMTILRAVETRRSVVRAANTGVSAIIEPSGEIVVESALFEDWAEGAQVPLLLGKTVYVAGGYLFAPFCLFVVTLWLGLQWVGRRKE